MSLKENHVEESSKEDVRAVNIENIEAHMRLGVSNDDATFFETFTPAQRKALIWKIDIRLVPFLALLYLCAHIDRANIGNAKIEGLTTDLGLTDTQYNIALSIFFIPYVLLEVPSNVVLKRFARPSTYLGILILAWGITMTLTGIVKGYGGLVAARFALGVAEAGFFPGAVYLITQWYMPHEVQTRIAIFFSASALSGAFSGLLAFAIAKMNGVGGYEGWRWIFIIEGLATIVIGIATFPLLVDSPALSKRWLSEDEMRFMRIQTTIREGGSKVQEAAKKFEWSHLVSVITDYKIYLQAWILFSVTTCSYGLKFTMPSITKSMGYSSSNAQLLTIPPYVCGAISAFCFAKVADRFRWRAPFIIIPMTCVVVGFAIIFPLASNIKQHIAPCYIGVVLCCIGTYPTNPGGSAWLSNNVAGLSRRNIAIAFNISFGNMGGVLGSYIYIGSQSPGYPVGFGVSLAIAASAVCSALTLELIYKRENAKKALMTEEEVREKYTDEDLGRLGDKSPLFRYTL